MEVGLEILFLISYNFKSRISRVQTFAIGSSSGTNFREIEAKSRKFIPAKVNTFKVIPVLRECGAKISHAKISTNKVI